jgi:coenzyme F420-reducing hydrogenase beta subunit
MENIKRTDKITNAYQGYLKDNDELIKSASGGLCTSISKKIIGGGGVVFGVAYSDDFRSAHYEIATNFKGLENFKGSKYIKPELHHDGVFVFESIKTQLDIGKPVLFVALPCAATSLTRYLGRDCQNLYLIDLICHGVTENKVEQMFLDELEEKYKSKIIDFTLRAKPYGWCPFYITAIFENGNEFERSFNDTDFGYAFGNYKRYFCTRCIIKKGRHTSDLTIGDFWGITSRDEGYNKDGVSIAFVRTEKGEKLLSSLDDFILSKADIDFALSNNLTVNYQIPFDMEKRKKIKGLINRMSLHSAIEKVRNN